MVTLPPVPALSPNDTKIDLLATLVSEKSADSLSKLLTINSETPPSIASLGTAFRYMASDSDEPANTGHVKDVGKITSADNVYTVCVATLQFIIPNGPGSMLANTESGYVFNQSGDLVGQIGGRLNGRIGETVQFLALGSSNTWFGVVTRAEAALTPPVRTNVYVIEENIPQAVTFKHHLNDFSYPFQKASTESRNQPLAEECRISFHGPNRQARGANCVCADGELRMARVLWNPHDRRFQGPSICTVENQLVYEIDRDKSNRFEASDIASSVAGGTTPVD